MSIERWCALLLKGIISFTPTETITFLFTEKYTQTMPHGSSMSPTAQERLEGLKMLLTAVLLYSNTGCVSTKVEMRQRAVGQYKVREHRDGLTMFY